MGSTRSRRLGATALAAALATGLGATPALGRSVHPYGHSSRMSVTGSAPTGATTASTWPTPTRTQWRLTPVPRGTRILAVDPAAAEVVRLVNVARADAGCSPLRVDPRLTAAARLHSEDMAAQNYFSHTSLDGRTPWDRMRAQGYTDGSGENIAAGYSTPAAVMTAWLNSSGHRANILNCSSRAIGVGIGKGGSYGTYWTQDFGYS